MYQYMHICISAFKRCSVRINFQLFVGRLVSYLHYLHFFVFVFVFFSCVQWCPTYCLLLSVFLYFVCLFVGFCLRLVSCVPNVTRFSVFSILDCPFSFCPRLCNQQRLYLLRYTDIITISYYVITHGGCHKSSVFMSWFTIK